MLLAWCGFKSKSLLIQPLAKRFYTATVEASKAANVALPKIQIEQKHAVSRRHFTKEEDKKLLKLYAKYPRQWSRIASEFDQRAPPAILNRYKALTSKDIYYGPYKKAEIEELKKLVAKYGENDWAKVANEMPRKRDPLVIRRTWMEALDPQHTRGPWTAAEDKALMEAIPIYHTEGNQVDWSAVADVVRTRNRKQCYERFMYQLNPSHARGRYTPLEDAKILTAVQKYGDKDWLKIKEVTGIHRTTRNISAHYKYYLDPSIDRSPWSEEETKTMVELFEKHESMAEVREIMKSRRSLKHMWSHYYMSRLGSTPEARDEAIAKKRKEQLAIKLANESEKPLENKI
ncbi:Myblike DNAbinding domain-containing protein [Umbelopsis nana]